MMRKSEMKRKKWAERGYNDGFHSGFQTGYAHGDERGRQAGLVEGPFEGTSIIIPTYNQLNYLRECIESIQVYTTDIPYELIIIDNGSNDGTAQYVKSLAHVRCSILADNRGFAGAVNQGLKMARGTTLLILNNDAVVTQSWLSNLLTCLHSDAQHGIVGPVTNYISGDQLISTNYSDIVEMQQFASAYNQSHSQEWHVTNRLTGFCMLLRRDTFLRLGYFDEVFEIGNCEDDDYGLRARLLGLKLIIARDTFIHHYGSVSMKSLNTRFDEVYGSNLISYSSKWSDPHGYLSLDWQMSMESTQLRNLDFYPTCMIVRGVNAPMYWIEQGCRYLIRGECGLEPMRVSQIDLRSWGIGGVLTSLEVIARIQSLEQKSDAGSIMEGSLVQLLDGLVYQLKCGRLHRFINTQALASWRIGSYCIIPITLDQSVYSVGPPIICPPVIKADNI